jgi:hypothetical protein
MTKVYCGQCKWFKSNFDPRYETCTEKSNFIYQDTYKEIIVLSKMLPKDLNANNDCENYAGIKLN